MKAESCETGIRRLKIKGDSKLVVNQVQGQWKCNFPHLEVLLNDAKSSAPPAPPFSRCFSAAMHPFCLYLIAALSPIW